jgi:lambda family phage tail tape measure protein
MTDLETEAERLAMIADELESAIGGTEAATSAFRAELDAMEGAMQAAGAQAAGLSRSLNASLKSAFDDLIFDGAKLSDVLGGIGRSVTQSAYNAAITPVTHALGGVIGKGLGALMGGILPFANGAAFSAGRVMPFAEGGVVSGPTFFPMRGATGLMGEAGPEAILPLARGADGKLGIRAGGGQGTQVTINIATPDVEGFRRSQSQIAAGISRALSRGNRNL